MAPALDPTVVTSLKDATSFLYDGAEPVQMGMAPDTIAEERVAVLRGELLTKAGEPLPGVTITVLDHPDLGMTVSRDDGRFDLAVNGGGELVVQYEKVKKTKGTVLIS